MIRRVVALLRASWLTATSYRIGLVFSIVGLVATFVPLYFVANALQPVVAESIQDEGRQYFGFLVVGLAVMYYVAAAVRSLSEAVAAGIGSGTLEAMLATPSRVSALFVGMVAYPMAWTTVRVLLLGVLAIAIGMPVAWSGVPLGIAILALTVVSYLAIGLLAAALILAFRTTGPLITGVLTVSTLLGGVYYSTSVIPSWIQSLSTVVPLTYGLRAVRRVVLGGMPFAAVRDDVLALGLMSAGLMALGAWVVGAALRYARRTGTLAQY